MNRRRFLKYVGGTATIVGASALGLDYLLNSKPLPSQQTTTGMHEPPAIKNLQWTPTRTVNGKVYDGTVSFEAEGSNSPVVGAELTFDPVYPQEIPMQAFTTEPTRSYSLSSNAMRADFSQTIRGLVGGKSYKALVTVKDQYGGQSQANLDIPYIREFEDITSKSKAIVGVQYGMWFNGPPWSRGRTWTTLVEHPLLGEYDSMNPIVIEKHLDWLSGHGVTSVLPFVNGRQMYVNAQSLISNQLAVGMKIAITYDLTSLERTPPSTSVYTGGFYVDLNSEGNVDKLTQDFRSMARDFFSNPNYLTVNGRPLVYMYQAGVLKGDVVGVLTKIRQRLLGDYGLNVYLVGNVVAFWLKPKEVYVKPYDAVTNWIGYSRSADECCSNFEANLDELFATWSSLAKRSGVGFIPSVSPGFIAERPEQSDWPVLSKSPDRLRRQIQIGKKYLNKDTPIFLVSTFNDWAENTTIEPTVEEGFNYLQVLKDEFT